ncbi:hypothetical protein [Tsuneonella sp. HG222]
MDAPETSPPPGRAPSRTPRRLNADYRWTMPKVLAFLEALATCGSVAQAARAVGMSRQSAYRMRARLAGTPVAAAIEGARRQGIRARAAASAARNRSRWDGEGLGEYLARQGAARALQGDTVRPQGDAPKPQGDTPERQDHALERKATEYPPDRVTPGPCRPRPQGSATAQRAGAPLGLASGAAKAYRSRRVGPTLGERP